jgi:hypothetical protein
MSSNVKLIPMLTRLSLKSTVCAISATMLLSVLLTGCVTKPLADSESLSQSRLYSPSVLRLPAGQPVQTLDGLYTPTGNEVWHSDARFRIEEQQLLDAVTALNQLRNQKQ